ncbi:MAG TPA: AMP-binding protein [Spirochaetota bacterium]|nr:AMP-binding protein [Spirochaetota bacterium]HOS32179.1 AMP-binding protein [Spirochaetota bacterium]HOS55488.1 AMP-binding protein [Spirochaetota bacterium]HPK62004.1 AMP-binding protein [Spirochaetota bacterium]HQF78031.1 AMP-binding protein [Spirochaetota bacterium]
MYENLRTLVDVIYNSKERFPDKDFLQHKDRGVENKFQSISYREFVVFMENLSASLYDIGVRKGDKIGFISDNCYKWLIADMAIQSLGAADVPRGSDSTADEISYILNHSDSKFCIAEDPAQVNKILTEYDNFSGIKDFIILFGKIEDIKSSDKTIRFHHFDNLLKDGEQLKNKYKRELEEIRNSITEEDLATIIYTSGTTGLPKGVMLLHKNILQNLHSMPSIMPATEKDRWVSILPVWHVFERTVEYCIMVTCGSMAYSKPVAKYLLPDLAEIRPTFMVSVPRVWEALYTGIIANVKKGSKIKGFLFKFFVAIGTVYMKQKRILLNRVPIFKKPFFLVTFFKKLRAVITISLLFVLDALGDILVFSKIREKTGGALICPISGGGALPEYVDNFFSTIKINIFEGYGLTETSPIVSVRDFYRPVAKTVGKPAPGVEVMIGDDNWNKLPNQHEKGIVYVKGDLVMAGYYKDKEKTDAIIKDNWFNTGDLGRLTITGEIQLSGRAKDTIVLTGGENIEPNPIEDKLLEEPLINQVMVVGQDKKTLGALVVPAREPLEEFAKQNGIAFKDFKDLCKNDKVLEEYSKIIKHRISHHTGFKNFEKITGFVLLPDPFEVGKELTNSLKMKRNVISEKYKKEIEDIYKKN